MKIDAVLPHFHFSEHHSIRVDAPPEHIWSVIRHGERPAHPLIRLLFFLRGRRAPQTFSLDKLSEGGFRILEEDPPREIVLGIEGPFWKPSCKLTVLDDATFTRPIPNGVARGAWNFVVHADGTVSTETRVLCAADSKRKFALYWFFIRPFSGLIRRLMLRAIRKACTA